VDRTLSTTLTSIVAERDARDRSAAMKSPRRGPFARTAFLLLLAACGSRTGLFGTDGDSSGLLPDGGTIIDGGRLPDGAPIVDGGPIPTDAPLPMIDAMPRPDANRTDCPDADSTLVYVVTDANELYSFFPTDGTFKFISNLACPAGMNATPFSMAVDRKGVAYVEFTDARLYRVSTATGACIGTSYQPNQQGFGQFGMGFATNDIGPTETLFVAGTSVFDPMGNPLPSPGLARIDPATFTLNKVGPFLPDIQNAELTGTGDGRLFAFYNKNQGQGIPGGSPPPSFIGEIDTNNAHVVAETPFPTVGQGTGWAFAFWGGDFYMFTAPAGTSDVTRWRPADNSVSVVASLPAKIVGAGVSTCAPAQ
jgi:hypothetical protein